MCQNNGPRIQGRCENIFKGNKVAERQITECEPKGRKEIRMKDKNRMFYLTTKFRLDLAQTKEE